MPYLPVELLEIICSEFTNVDDSKCFRLVGKAHALAGAKRLIPAIYGTFSTTELQRLKEMVNQPIVRKHVNTLVLVPGHFDRRNRYLGFEEWVRRSRGHMERTDAGGGRHAVIPRSSVGVPSNDDMRTWHSRYCKSRAKPSASSFLHERIDSIMSEVVEQTLLCPKLQHLIVADDRLFARQDAFYDSCPIFCSIVYPQDVARALTSILMASQAGKKEWQSMTVLDLSWDALFRCMVEAQALQRNGILDHLRVVRTLFGATSGDREVIPEVAEQRSKLLAMRLSEAIQLKTLKLACRVKYKSTLDLQSALASCNLQHLTSFSLRGFLIGDAALRFFLERHRESLTVLRLRSVCLSSGTWSDFIKSLANTLPKLKKFRFSGTLESTAIGQEFVGCHKECDPLSHNLNDALERYIISGKPEDWPPEVDLVTKDFRIARTAECIGGRDQYDSVFQ